MTLTASGDAFAIGAFGFGGAHGEVALLNNGNFITVWSNNVFNFAPGPGTDEDATAIVGQILGPDGAPIGSGFQINTSETGFQTNPEVTVLSNGTFLVAWRDGPNGTNGFDTYGQLFAQDGTPIGDEFNMATTSDGDQDTVQIKALPTGGFIAIWADDRANAFGQYFDELGARVGPEFIVAAATATQRLSLVVLDNGDIRYVAGEQLYTSDGTTVTSGSNIFLNSSSSSSLNTKFAQNFETDMALMADGSRYVTAGIKEINGTHQIVAVMRDGASFDNIANGEQGIFGTLTVSETGFSTNLQNLVAIEVTALSNGGFLVVWGVSNTNTTAGFDVYAQAYDGNSIALGGNVLVYEDMDAYQGQPFAQEGADGKILIGWSDQGQTVSDNAAEIVGRLFEIEGLGPAQPTDGADVLSGTSGNDTIDGLKGNDTITGGQGDDHLIGNFGADTLYGGEGDDRLDGSQGKDRLEGGAGSDSMFGGGGDDFFFGGSNGFDLGDIIDGGTGNDEIYSAFGDDDVSGNKGSDTIYGGFGDDTLKGAGGDDSLYGDTDNDRLFGGMGRDSLFGGSGDDLLEGSGQADHLQASAGSNTLKGGNGDDTLIGGIHNDILNGGKGRDQFTGGAGNDTMTGGVSNDDFIFADDFGNDVITDFNANAAGEDIDLSALTNITDFADLAANHMAQVGADVVITDGADSITLLGVDIAKLDAEDFLF